MTLMEASQLLGNFGEFAGAIAVVATLFYLAAQVKHSKDAVNANTESLNENRKLQLAGNYQARTDNMCRNSALMAGDESLAESSTKPARQGGQVSSRFNRLIRSSSFVGGRTAALDQQALQAIQRSRELLIRDRTAVSNHIRGLLLEFGIAIPKGFAHLHRHVPEILEDAENGVPHSFRSTLHLMHRRLLEIKRDIMCSPSRSRGW